MRRRVQIALGVLFIALIAVLGGQVVPDREPVYQGRRLSDWLQEYAAGGNPFADVEERAATLGRGRAAIGHMGTNALPFLLQMARAKDSPFKRFITAVARNQSLIRVHWRTDKEMHEMAVAGFYALGRIGKNAVPALIDLLRSTNNDVSRTARGCLGNIGPAAQAAVPVLVQFINDTNRIVRVGTMMALGRIHMDGALVVPILITNLTKSNAVLPTTIVTLGQFGEQAKPAVPTLLQFLNDDNEYVRVEATNALKAIDPEAAARAGVK
jgi:HEAT repeat protein